MRSAPGGLRGRLMSYFEEEENWDYMLERPDSFASEDNLLIRVRELDGPIMQAGKTRNLDLLRVCGSCGAPTTSMPYGRRFFTRGSWKSCG